MGSNIFSILNTAKLGLLSQQLAIEVTGQNIANVQTEGYSRQEVKFEATTPRSFSLGQLGTGVRVAGIERSHDEFLFSQILSEGDTLGRFQVRKDVFDQLEILLSENNGQSLNLTLSSFFSAIQDVSGNPTGLPERSSMLAEAQNLAVYERRLSALERARDRGEIDVARFEESRHELERNLLEDTEARRRVPLRNPLAGRFVIPLVITALIAATVTGYRWVGANGDLALYAVVQEVLNSPGASPENLIVRLEEQAESQPDNPKVWALLFPLYQKVGQPDRSIRALERLIELEGRRADLLAQLAQLKFYVAGGSLTYEVQALVDETLDKDPRQPTVLGMLGVEAFDDGRYEQAIGYWRRALAGFEDSASAEVIRKGIAVARQRLEETANGAERVTD